MKPDPENSKEVASSGSRTLMAEMEVKLREEKERDELLKSETELARFVACQETEIYKRDCMSLREKMGRLEEDCNILRERELKDQEKIKCLLVEIERKEREFKDKFVEFECGKKRAMNEVSEWKKKGAELEVKTSMLVDEIVRKETEIKELFFMNMNLACVKKRAEDEAHEWMNKYKELQARELRLGEEITPLKEKEREESTSRSLLKRPIINIDEELPMRSVDSSLKSRRKCLLLTLEQRGKSIVVVDSDNEGECGVVDSDNEEDRMTLSQIKQRKLTDLEDVPPRKQMVYVQPCKVGESEAEGTCSKASKVTDAQILTLPGKKAQEVADIGLRSYCKRNFENQISRKSYIGRIASSEQQLYAVQRAEELQSNLKSCHPSFVKSMGKSHVSGSFWLVLPTQFCKENLPNAKLKIILEDEKGSEYNVIYIGEKTALSGGWKGFALTHHLEFGDALIFELREPTKFKVYIIKANLESSDEDFNGRISEQDTAVQETPIQSKEQTPIQSKEQDVDLSLHQK